MRKRVTPRRVFFTAVALAAALYTGAAVSPAAAGTAAASAFDCGYAEDFSSLSRLSEASAARGGDPTSRREKSQVVPDTEIKTTPPATSSSFTDVIDVTSTSFTRAAARARAGSPEARSTSRSTSST